MTDKDSEQDELIRQNAASILRNEEAIRRQTAALEQIRDHYFPKRTAWKTAIGFFLKIVGAVTVATGVMEGVTWYWNQRQTNGMAERSAAVAWRLFSHENDVAGAVKFLEKAVELDGDTAEYRIRLTYVKGIAAIADLYDLGRPLTGAERARVDEILAESVFLQEIEPDAAMPHVLAAQVYGLRGEREMALAEADRAVALEPDNIQARVTACAQKHEFGDDASAREQLVAAERIDPQFPLMLYWKGILALEVDKDAKTARVHAEALQRRVPQTPLAHLLMGFVLMSGSSPDYPAARAAFAQTLVRAPGLVWAMTMTAETYEQEGNLTLARLWLDRALAQDARNMKALVARARIRGKTGDGQGAIDDLSTAINLAPLRDDLYRERALARAKVGDAAGAKLDEERRSALAHTQQTGSR